MADKTNVTEETRTFTEDEVNAIVETRLGREKAKYGDYDALKEKAAKLDEIEEANKTALQKAMDKASALEDELNSLKKANELRKIREQVAKETGVPVSLLTADTKEDCEKQAKAISEYAKVPYPDVRDGGEVHNTGKKTTREKFAEWADKALV